MLWECWFSLIWVQVTRTLSKQLLGSCTLLRTGDTEMSETYPCHEEAPSLCTGGRVVDEMQEAATVPP